MLLKLALTQRASLQEAQRKPKAETLNWQVGIRAGTFGSGLCTALPP